MQQALYEIRQDAKRKIIPSATLTITLSAVFYALIMINVSLLEIKVSSFVKTITVIVLLLLFLLDILIKYFKALNEKYVFYQDRIEYTSKKPKAFYFNTQKEPVYESNKVDQFFSTGSITLGDFKIEHIKNSNQVYYYIKQLMAQNINYYQNQQQAF